MTYGGMSMGALPNFPANQLSTLPFMSAQCPTVNVRRRIYGAFLQPALPHTAFCTASEGMRFRAPHHTDGTGRQQNAAVAETNNV